MCPAIPADAIPHNKILTAPCRLYAHVPAMTVRAFDAPLLPGRKPCFVHHLGDSLDGDFSHAYLFASSAIDTVFSCGLTAPPALRPSNGTPHIDAATLEYTEASR
jgi:hypothetical protein